MLAAPSDAKCNERFIAALATFGFGLLPIEDAFRRGLMGRSDSPTWAPVPFNQGKQYPYPSVIVSIGEATVCGDLEAWEP